MQTRARVDLIKFCKTELQWLHGVNPLRMTVARAKRILLFMHVIVYAVPHDATSVIANFVKDETLLVEQWLIQTGAIEEVHLDMIENIDYQLQHFHLAKNKATDRALRRRFQRAGMHAMFQPTQPIEYPLDEIVCCVCMDATRTCNFSAKCQHDLSLCIHCCEQLDLCPICRTE